MADYLSMPCTAFEGHRLLLSGPLVEVALAIKTATQNGSLGAMLVFDDSSGCVVDLDLRGTKAEIVERLSRHREEKPPSPAVNRTAEVRGRGRPKLGVASREVTLLPRHWEWLGAQPGGASATLRRLVEDARRSNAPREKRRAAQEAAYQFMLGIAGDLPGYEEATRALFADDRPRLEQRLAGWPQDVRTHVLRLAFGG